MDALPSLAKNLFRDVGTDNPGGKAINVTNDGHRKVPKDNMKMAVVLNFRLNSSNYATICLRELMSSALAEHPPPALGPVSLGARRRSAGDGHDEGLAVSRLGLSEARAPRFRWAEKKLVRCYCPYDNHTHA